MNIYLLYCTHLLIFFASLLAVIFTDIMANCGKYLNIAKAKSLRCDRCNVWFHHQCQGVATVMYQMLVETDLLWFCSECHKKIRGDLARVQNMEEELRQLKSNTP